MPKKKTHEEFLIDVRNKLGNDYEVLSQYTNAHGKVLMKHYICGNTFEKNIHDIITKGSGCPYCNGTKPALYNEQWVIDHTPLPYHYVTGYKSMKEKCIFHCDKCNINFEQLPSRLINQHLYGCNCQSTKKMTNQQFLDRLGPECLNEYEILEEYINMDTKISFKHKTCGCIFKLEPDKFLNRYNKKYCPICYYKKSHGEILIHKFLEQNNYEYQKEFTFPDLKNLRFDFYLPEENMIFEYDGEQHFYPIEFFGGEKALKSTQGRDQLKNQYCIKNHIQLFRIPYTEIDNINKILYKILKEKSSTTIEKFLVKE